MAEEGEKGYTGDNGGRVSMRKVTRIRGIKNTYGAKFVKAGLKRIGVSLSGVSSNRRGEKRNAGKVKRSSN